MMKRQLLASFLTFLGFCGVIVSCALPMWSVTAYVGANIITAQIYWEGLWMNCVLQSTGQMQCMPYESVLALTPEQQGSRALISASIGVAVAAICMTVIGGECTSFYDYDLYKKARIGIAAGALYIVAGGMCIGAVSWSAYVIIAQFYDPEAIDATKGELGASIYIGWAAGALLIIGGLVLLSTYCSRC